MASIPFCFVQVFLALHSLYVMTLIIFENFMRSNFRFVYHIFDMTNFQSRLFEHCLLNSDCFRFIAKPFFFSVHHIIDTWNSNYSWTYAAHRSWPVAAFRMLQYSNYGRCLFKFFVIFFLNLFFVGFIIICYARYFHLLRQ